MPTREQQLEAKAQLIAFKNGEVPFGTQLKMEGTIDFADRIANFGDGMKCSWHRPDEDQIGMQVGHFHAVIQVSVDYEELTGEPTHWAYCKGYNTGLKGDRAERGMMRFGLGCAATPADATNCRQWLAGFYAGLKKEAGNELAKHQQV